MKRRNRSFVLFLIPFFISCGTGLGTSSNSSVGGEALLASMGVSEDEKLDLTVHLVGMELKGLIQIDAVSNSGSLSARVYIAGMSAAKSITGQINGSTLTINDFDVTQSLGEGKIKNLAGSINSTVGSVTGNFDFLMSQSDSFPSLKGDTLPGTFSIAPSTTQTNSVSTVSWNDFVTINTAYDVGINITGFQLEATATLTSYDEKTGKFKAIFKNEEYDITTNITGQVGDETLGIDSFKISSSLVTGTVSSMEGTFNENEETIEGGFKFKLEASPLFDQFVGSTFSGSFVITR